MVALLLAAHQHHPLACPPPRCPQKENPLHYLRLDARSCRLFKNEAQYYAIENNEGLVPWAGQQDNLIDRYDVRSLLDMYVEPDKR